MWNLPPPGIKQVSLALQSGFLSTGSLGKPLPSLFYSAHSPVPPPCGPLEWLPESRFQPAHLVLPPPASKPVLPCCLQHSQPCFLEPLMAVWPHRLCFQRLCPQTGALVDDFFQKLPGLSMLHCHCSCLDCLSLLRLTEKCVVTQPQCNAS